MRLKHFVAVSGAAALMYWGMGSRDVMSGPPITLRPDGSIQMETQNLRCGGVRSVLEFALAQPWNIGARRQAFSHQSDASRASTGDGTPLCLLP